MAVGGLVLSVSWRFVLAKMTVAAMAKRKEPGQAVSANVRQNGLEPNANWNCARPRIVAIKELHLAPVQTFASVNV
jgi:hypothetical protein